MSKDYINEIKKSYDGLEIAKFESDNRDLFDEFQELTETPEVVIARLFKDVKKRIDSVDCNLKTCLLEFKRKYKIDYYEHYEAEEKKLHKRMKKEKK